VSITKLSYHFSGLFRSPVDTPPDDSARSRPGRVRELPLSVTIVLMVTLFPAMAIWLSIFQFCIFRAHFYHSHQHFAVQISYPRVLYPFPPDKANPGTGTLNPIILYVLRAEKMKRIRRLSRPMRRPRRRGRRRGTPVRGQLQGPQSRW
jgi:hypothetical protein